MTDGQKGTATPVVPAEGYTPPAEIIRTVERITAQAGMEIGGVEYLESDDDGRLYFYDVNALSNFVAEAPRVIGFDPFERLVDFLIAELEAERTATAGMAGAGV